MSFKPFDPLTLPAAPLQLIEASAGTGKTYSITSLYLRFILEQELPVERVLVLSFTEAATAELHERLRSRLQAALNAFRRGGDGDDPLLAALVAGSSNREREQRLLQKAISEMDQAAVTTIHSFCQRILQQGAFESGLPFELELVGEISPLLDELIRDYLAGLFHGDDPRLVALLQRHHGWNHWRRVAEIAARHRYFPVVPGVAAPPSGVEDDSQITIQSGPGITLQQQDLAALTEAVCRTFTRARRCWKESRPAIEESLNPDIFYADLRREFAGGLLSRLAAYLAPPQPDSFITPAGSEKLTPEQFNDPAAKVCMKAPLKKGLAPDHPFFASWGSHLAALARLGAAYRLAVGRGLIEFTRRQLPARLYLAGRQSFDDLLYSLEQALKGPGRQALAALIAARYPVALIDEFQDTDPVQYAIFKAVYGQGVTQSAPLLKGHGPLNREVADLGERIAHGGRDAVGGLSAPRRLILIGDPKQAIYAFRGADIFAYLGAAGESGEQRYTMTVNWRADRGMVAAINALFSKVAAPFLVPEIDFPLVSPRPGAAECWRGGKHGGRAPLQFLTLPSELAAEVGGPRSKWPVAGKVERVLPELVAADMVNLFRGGAAIAVGGNGESRPLRPDDVAVLVRSHYQAEAIREALGRRGIKAVVYSQASVFRSREARQLTMLLHGLLESAGEQERRAAMLSELLAVSTGELLRLGEDEQHWQQWLDDFGRWRLLWRERGFMAMIRALGEEKRLAARLLAAPDGERKLTNYRHLFELLHQQEREEHLGATALLKGLDGAIAGGGQAGKGGGEAAELRLESDGAAVRVLTIHRSKGLEFPVVYCPYLWKSGRRQNDERDEVFTYHDPRGRREGKIALLPDGEQRRSRREEAFAEELRLLYVALTRAKHCCLVPWEAATGYEKSALAYLLCGDQESEQGQRPQTAALTELERDDLLARLAARVEKESAWQLRSLPLPQTVGLWQEGEREGGQVADCRVLRREIAHAWRVGSFSRLAARSAETHHDPGTGRDYDAAAQDLTAAGGEGGAELEAGREAGAGAGAGAGMEAGPGAEAEAGAAAADGSSLLNARIAMADFPAGLAVGNLIHRIFELISFADGSRHREIIAAELATCGLGDREGVRLAVLQQAVTAVLQTPLPASEPFCLAEIADRHRLNEMPFIFPLCQQDSPLEPERLAAAFAAHPSGLPPGYPEELRNLQFSAIQGYLKGFVDLVFCWNERWYIVDYKSNLLGSTYGDYLPGRLQAPMAAHHYTLQYHIYTVALHRHLNSRLPGYDYQRHFGGVFYLFLRGMAPELGASCGISAHRPPPELIEALSKEIF